MLPKRFPFRDIFTAFIDEYTFAHGYWYVPKARVLDDANVASGQKILRAINEDYVDRTWNVDVQDELLDRLIADGILDPYKPDATLKDRTALVRIIKTWLQTLGFLWAPDNKPLTITDAGSEFLTATDPRPIVEQQIAKFQYPAWATPAHPDLFVAVSEPKRILPHLFLLQALQALHCRISVKEFELFINLATDQSDLERICRYVSHWRDLTVSEQAIILSVIDSGPAKARAITIRQDGSYQRSFFSYPSYLELEGMADDAAIVCRNPALISKLISRRMRRLHIPMFSSQEEWIAYFGDPKQKPSWFNYLLSAVETAPTQTDVKLLLSNNTKYLTPPERRKVRIKQIERAIEDFYVKQLDLLEPGLRLVRNGRQFITPIGRIDLLCKSATGEYVIVEVKAGAAKDAVFGQILRYIGWVNRNLGASGNDIRGIILARDFSSKARFSRIGLLREDTKRFIKFAKHGLNVSNIA